MSGRQPSPSGVSGRPDTPLRSTCGLYRKASGTTASGITVKVVAGLCGATHDCMEVFRSHCPRGWTAVRNAARPCNQCRAYERADSCPKVARLTRPVALHDDMEAVKYRPRAVAFLALPSTIPLATDSHVCLLHAP